MNSLLPLFTALSGVTFTIAYYSIYKKNEESCCSAENDNKSKSSIVKWSKSIFWIGLFFTIAFYGYSLFANANIGDGVVVKQSTSCSTEKATSSCSKEN